VEVELLEVVEVEHPAEQVVVVKEHLDVLELHQVVLTLVVVVEVTLIMQAHQEQVEVEL
tara:strand:+ start:627 stop:803 length:177 start_codon:yes stop_codon:yes gene_type:complete